MGQITTITLLGNDPYDWGCQHGETFRTKIRELYNIRLERILEGENFSSENDVLFISEKHLPLLSQYDKDLFQELYGIAKASNLSLQQLVVLNNYTDFRDIKTKKLQNISHEGCSIIYSPHGKFLGQTWDMHGTAIDYVVLIKLPNAILFSITGCLGMTGLNKYGVGIAINNLTSIDAKTGILWPTAVRRCLRESSALSAKNELLNCPLGSGHHYAIADKTNFYSIETCGSQKKVYASNPQENFFHTNHCLDKEIAQKSLIRPNSSTLERYRKLKNHYGKFCFSSNKEIFNALKIVDMPFQKNAPNKSATCGVFVMDLQNQSVLTCKEFQECHLTTIKL